MNKKRILHLILIIIILFTITAFTKTLGLTTYVSNDMNFLAMQGNLIEHPYKDNDSLSEQKIIELQNNEGLTLWYGRYFHKDICVTGLCRMVKLWIFWDATGGYLGFRPEENYPLTRQDHIPFEKDDYKRLNTILADRNSIFRSLNYEDLIVREKENKSYFHVDGYSSTTQPYLSDYAIKGAAYTCYTLWHTTHGPTRRYIADSIITPRINKEYIEKLLKGNEKYKLFALNLLSEKPFLFDKFENTIFELIAFSDIAIAEKALSNIPNSFLENKINQHKLIDILDTAHNKIKYAIIYRLQDISELDYTSILFLFDKYNSGKISSGALNLIYDMLTSDLFQNKKIKKELIKFSRFSDNYVKNLTKSLLEKQTIH